MIAKTAPTGYFFKILNLHKMNTDNIKLFGEVRNRQKIMDNNGIVPENGFTGRFGGKNRLL